MRIFLLVVALLVEAAFLSLSHWQYRRYLSALDENATLRPQIVLSGSFIPSATTVLDNQPNSTNPSTIGWRLLVPFQTASQTLLVDRGWQPLPPDRSTFPPALASLTSAIPTSLTVTLQAYPTPKGWLQSPLTTTDNRILTRMHPAPILVAVSISHFAYEITPETHLPPKRNPAMHQSYMLQWLGLALAFPLMVFFSLRRRPR